LKSRSYVSAYDSRGYINYFPKGTTTLTGSDFNGNDAGTIVVSRLSYEQDCRAYCASLPSCLGALVNLNIVNAGNNSFCVAKNKLVAGGGLGNIALYI
jgi:hypothetical protein